MEDKIAEYIKSKVRYYRELEKAPSPHHTAEETRLYAVGAINALHNLFFEFHMDNINNESCKRKETTMAHGVGTVSEEMVGNSRFSLEYSSIGYKAILHIDGQIFNLNLTESDIFPARLRLTDAEKAWVEEALQRCIKDAARTYINDIDASLVASNLYDEIQNWYFEGDYPEVYEYGFVNPKDHTNFFIKFDDEEKSAFIVSVRKVDAR